MGAWIEIFWYKNILSADKVAPYMGAWIEIVPKQSKPIINYSRSLHGSVD